MSSPITSFIAFASEESDLTLLRAFAAARSLADDKIFKGTITDASNYLKTNPSPDLLLVEIPSQQEAPALLDQLAEVCGPDTKVITIGKIDEYSFYCWLMDIGITQYLLSPLTESAVDHAFERLQAHVAQAKKDRPPSRLIAVMGTRGGVGASTVALNLAAILGEETHKKVALVDLDPQEGSISLALDIQPSVGLRDVLEKPDRIDSLFLERVMNKMGKYLSVLSAEERLSDQLAISDQAAMPLLEELRNKYDYIVLDVPRHLNHFTRTCLQTADFALLVTELSLLSLRDTLRMQDAMRDGWKTRPPMIIANRVGLAPKQEIPVVDFEKGAGAKIAEQIAFAPDIWMVVGRDVPAVKHKSHASVQPLYRLAAAIAPEIKLDTPGRKNSFSLPFFKKKEG
ncbi:MAG: AAA family ATPase [Alphaproteobacteria bacterium]|nr:AAA family ATPase [Alphaproteobacteria bacterium]